MRTNLPSFRDPVLQNLNAQLDIHFSHDSLTVKELLKLVGTSRTTLHRKLKQAVKMSTTQYIRCFRLQQAAVLLRRWPEWSIYQIALEVGFSSQSYFTKKFKGQFGVCPRVFRVVQQASFLHMEHLSKNLEHTDKIESGEALNFAAFL